MLRKQKKQTSEKLVRHLRDYTGITAEEMSDEKIIKMYKDTYLMKRIELDEAVNQSIASIKNSFPFVMKVAKIFNKIVGGKRSA